MLRGDIAQLIECLPSTQEALGSVLSTTYSRQLLYTSNPPGSESGDNLELLTLLPPPLRVLDYMYIPEYLANLLF